MTAQWTIEPSQVDPASLPILFTRGTHYDVGYQIGSNFKERIQKFFQNSRFIQSKLLPFLSFQKGRDIYNMYLGKVEEQFPYYVDEIRGMADGSKIPFEKIFLYNMSPEVYDIHFKEVCKEHKDTSGCTTVLLNRPDFKIMAHNEDCNPEISKYSYIVQADISDRKYGDRCESVTAFLYPGSIMGRAFGFNKSGMVFCVDGLLPTKIIKAFTPRAFLNRAMLSAKTIEETVSILENKGYGSAFGFCVNIASVKCPQTMWNIEVAPGTGGSQVNVFEIIEQKRHYVHSNLYQHLEVENAEGLHSSHARKIRAEEFPPPENLHDIKLILGDTTNVKYPIYRLANEYNLNQTASTAIIDVLQKTIEIYIGNVKTTTKPLVVLPIQID